MKQYLPLVILSIIYIAIVLTQMPIAENIWHYSFDDGTYSHAYLIPFISMYLYWNLFTAGELQFNNKVNYIYLLITVLLGYALLTFSLAQFPTGYRITLIFFISSITVLIFKPSIKIIFPSFFLIFLVPVWGIITPYLQALSTTAVSFIMSYSSIPTYVEGNLISIPSGVFEIAGGCSGLRYLIVSLAISSLFIFLNVKKYSQGFWFLTVAIIGALITNWIRIAALISIGHFTNMESELMKDHNDFGWYLYIPFLISLFYFGHRFIPSPMNQDKLTISNTSINISTLSLAILIVLAFSDYTKQVLVTFQDIAPEQCDKALDNIPKPQLHGDPQVCVQDDAHKIQISYTYLGSKLDDSVNYYLNVFEPINWKIINKRETNKWQTLLVNKGDTYYFISYKFISGNNETSNLNSLRKYKLLNAAKGISQTKLIWLVERCNALCLKTKI